MKSTARAGSTRRGLQSAGPFTKFLVYKRAALATKSTVQGLQRDVPATKSALGSPQSVLPATKSGLHDSHHAVLPVRFAH